MKMTTKLNLSSGIIRQNIGLSDANMNLAVKNNSLGRIGFLLPGQRAKEILQKLNGIG